MVSYCSVLILLLGAEAKEEGHVVEEDEISIQKILPLLYLDEEKDK